MFIIIYVTHPDKYVAHNICDTLIKKRLVACSNIFPITSSFRWEGEIKNEEEVVSILKTKVKLYQQVEEQIKNLHPYECPCIIKMEATANSEYEEWINKKTL